MLDAVRHFRAAARAKMGREVDHILLLHANALNADHLGALLDALKKDGAEFVSVDAALKDEVYRRPDRYAGGLGISWLYRIDPVTTTRPWDDRTWAAIKRRFGKPSGR